MEFYAKIRNINGTLVVTIPKQNVEALNLQEKQLCKFTIEVLANGKRV